MKDNKELKIDDLNSVSGAGTNLEKYLKSLAGNDKSKVLVDYGTGIQLDLNPSVNYEENNNVRIIKREKEIVE